MKVFDGGESLLRVYNVFLKKLGDMEDGILKFFYALRLHEMGCLKCGVVNQWWCFYKEKVD